MEQVLIHTSHSAKRSRQRAVSEQMISDTIRFGEVIRKQGLRYFIMTEKRVGWIEEKQYKDRIKNTVVVMGDNNTIITVYKNTEAIKHIKKKSKRLWKRADIPAKWQR